MTITVVIANYNYAHLAAQAIDSVLCQTRKADEIIFVDDLSTERVATLDELPNYPITKLYRNQNLGVVDNFNDVLFNHVKTSHVLFLGADNWLVTGALDQLERVANYEKSDITSYNLYLVGTEANKFTTQIGVGDIAEEFISGNKIWRFPLDGNIEERNYIHGSSLYNVELARKVGGYERNPNGIHSDEDWMLWKKMLRAGAIHAHTNWILMYYRRHKENFNKI